MLLLPLHGCFNFLLHSWGIFQFFIYIQCEFNCVIIFIYILLPNFLFISSPLKMIKLNPEVLFQKFRCGTLEYDFYVEVLVSKLQRWNVFHLKSFAEVGICIGSGNSA